MTAVRPRLVPRGAERQEENVVHHPLGSSNYLCFTSFQGTVEGFYEGPMEGDQVPKKHKASKMVVPGSGSWSLHLLVK